LPDAVKNEIVELRTDDRPYDPPQETRELGKSYKWRHQETAVAAFQEAGSGVLEMATGTGKTRTSLKILESLRGQGELETLVVATRGNDLLDQWSETLLDHFDATEMFLYRQYGGHKDLGNFLLTPSDRLEILLLSYSNLELALDSADREDLENSMLICDEVHNVGAPQKREALAGRLSVFDHRLGLSATPFDPYDESRNEFIRENIGRVVLKFGLQEAIERGILVELEYTPLMYELSADDKAKQKEVFSTFAGLKKNNPSVPQSQLYIMLAKVKKESEEKLPAFETYLNSHPEILDSCLIFVETKTYGRKVQEIIFDYTDEFHTYYGEDDESELQAFASGSLSTLVTSRAIAEGISIRSVENIVLFTAPRARGPNIQRIGRALRKDPSNPDKRANILDFIVESELEEELSDEADEEMTPPDRARYDWLTDLSTVTHSDQA
jgi:superfamily II DNA or RNA helicase